MFGPEADEINSILIKNIEKFPLELQWKLISSGKISSLLDIDCGIKSLPSQSKNTSNTTEMRISPHEKHKNHMKKGQTFAKDLVCLRTLEKVGVCEDEMRIKRKVKRKRRRQKGKKKALRE